MSLLLFVDKLPAELQESYKAEVSKYIAVTDREAAKKLIGENQFLSAEFQSALSLKHEESIGKFKAEKLPGLIDEEIKKKTSKQPWEIEIEKIREENLALKREGVLKERRVEAIAELSKHGLDASLADFVVTDDIDKFKVNMDTLIGKTTSWRDIEIKRVKEGTYNQKSPQGSENQSGKVMVESDFSKLSAKEKSAFMAGGGSLQ